MQYLAINTRFFFKKHAKYSRIPKVIATLQYYYLRLNVEDNLSDTVRPLTISLLTIIKRLE